MENNTPWDRIEGPQVPEAETSPAAAVPAVPEFQHDAEPDIGAQFAAIHDDYGRERLRAAMRRGLNGPALSCATSLALFFIWRMMIPELVLYALAVVSLVRAWKALRMTTILDDREKASWNQRLALVTGFVVITGLVYLVFILLAVTAIFLAVMQGPRPATGSGR